jgi:hypothetical protein
MAQEELGQSVSVWMAKTAAPNQGALLEDSRAS